MPSPTTADLITAILEIREDEIPGIVEAMLADGADPASIVDTCREAMNTVGQRFEAGEAFIPELIMAGEMMRGISEQVRPHLKEGGESENLGYVVLGTVKGDIHDIGKDIVGSILDAAGFEVVDLGVDVPEPTASSDSVVCLRPGSTRCEPSLLPSSTRVCVTASR
jgi:5-methyltetrahydrofolate--homocysteine methyltransferase